MSQPEDVHGSPDTEPTPISPLQAGGTMLREPRNVRAARDYIS